MSNKSVSLKFFETYAGRHDVEVCRPLFAEGATIHSTLEGAAMDVNGYQQIGRAFLAGFPDIDAKVVEQLEDGNKVINRVVWAGTHTGTFKGIAPTGRSFCHEGVTIDTVMDGRIVERRDYSDMMQIMQQLGVLAG
jgi:steroid delta-isomerase-like uncharacterized protein